jgi:aspartyl-tRNA(Asn)/glutamyl-tRNA(Gln) amidotransferase subunit C
MIKEEDVKHIAWLARLELSEEEIEKFTSQLGQVLEHAAKIKEVDTSQTSPTTHALPLKNVFREDKVKPSLTQKEALKNASKEEKSFFVVPKIS